MTALDSQFSDIPHLLQNISEATKSYMRSVSTHIALAKKEALPPMSNPPEEVVFVQSGWLAVTAQDTTVSLLKEGDAFMGPVLPSASTGHAVLTLVAATNASVVLIKRPQLMLLLHERPDLMFALYDQVCARMTRVYYNMARHHTDPLEDRLASFLWSIGVPQESGHRSLPPITQSLLASCLGVGREEVSRKKQVLVQTGQLFKMGDEWLISKEIGRSLALRGLGD